MTDINFNGWKSGINNVAKEHLLEMDMLRSAVNVDLDRGVHPRRRAGYTRTIEGGHFESIHSFDGDLYFAKDSALCRSTDGVSYDELDSGWLEPTYVELNSELVISDGNRTALITLDKELTEFAAVGPATQSILMPAASGGLHAGKYQVALTYVNDIGHESGTKAAAEIEIEEGGGIQLTNIPQPTDSSVARVRIYASNANGEVLFFRTSVAVGQTDYILGRTAPKKRLQTQFLQPMPSSRKMLVYRGRLYVVEGRFLIFSETFNYRLHDPAKNYIPFSSRILGIAAVSGGIYVAQESGRVSFLSGTSPQEFSNSLVVDAKIQEGTLSVVDGKFVDPQLSGKEVVCWWTETGHMYFGTPDGAAFPVRDMELAIPSYEKGAIKNIKRDGLDQIISLMKNPQRNSIFAAEDNVDVTVRRNGINLGDSS